MLGGVALDQAAVGFLTNRSRMLRGQVGEEPFTADGGTLGKASARRSSSGGWLRSTRSKEQLGHARRVPLSLRQAILHEGTVGHGGGRRFTLVPAHVAEPAGSSDDAGHVLAAI